MRICVIKLDICFIFGHIRSFIHLLSVVVFYNRSFLLIIGEGRRETSSNHRSKH